MPIHRVVLSASSCDLLKDLSVAKGSSSSAVSTDDQKSCSKSQLYLKTTGSFSECMVDVFVRFLYFDELQSSEGYLKSSTIARLLMIGTEIRFTSLIQKCREWLLDPRFGNPGTPVSLVLGPCVAVIEGVDTFEEGRDLAEVLRELCVRHPTAIVQSLELCRTLRQIEMFIRMDLKNRFFLSGLIRALRRLCVDPLKYILERRCRFEYEDILQCMESNVLEKDQAMRLFQCKKHGTFNLDGIKIDESEPDVKKPRCN